MEGFVGTREQLRAWTSASDEERADWMDATEDAAAAVVEVGGRPAVVFMGNEGPDPCRPLLVYEKGVNVAVVLCGGNDEALRFAMEEPEMEEAVSEDFPVEGPLLVADLSEDWNAADPPTFELPLAAGSFCVDIRESGSGDDEGQVLVFWLPEDE